METSEIKQRRLEVLEETAAHFNSTNRSFNSEGGCHYFPVNPLSEGCAVGRLIKDKDICKHLDINGLFIDREDAFSTLPDELKELGRVFLRKVQNLHDNEHFWDTKGLTTQGKKAKQDIITQFCSEASIEV